jgi:parvulin-like peptidyl-prolyl isomerase
MGRFTRIPRFAAHWRPGGGALAALVLATALGAQGCKDKALQPGGRSADAGVTPGGLNPAQAALVVAKVGDREITLGEFAATLENMDQFDRLRYQTPERRKDLLEQIVTVELLAAEARARGLDKEPETVEALRQVLRDAILHDLRRAAPAPAEIPEAEVRAYYEAHKADFEEPERRRVAHIAVKDKPKADKLLTDARKATPAQFGQLALEHSLDSPGKGYKGPVEMLGDLGIVGPPGDARGDNPRVPPELRAAAFQITKLGDVLDRLVQTADGTFHVVRLVGKTDAHTRSYAEAERTIRITILQRGIAEREAALEAELRKQFPVQIDEEALGRVKLPFDPAATADAGVDSR